MNLDAVETGFLGKARTPDVFSDDTWNLFKREGTRGHVVGHLLACPDLALWLNGGRGDGQFPVELEGWVRNATNMPELQKNTATFSVHGGSDLLPTRDVFGSVDPRGIRVTMTTRRNRGGLGDDQAGARTLTIILGHQVRRDIGTFGATTGQWSHQDAVR